MLSSVENDLLKESYGKVEQPISSTEKLGLTLE